MKKMFLLLFAIISAGCCFAQSGSLDTMDAYGVYITYESQGCFHHKGRLLEIKKDPRGFMAKLYSINPELAFNVDYDPKENRGILLDSVVLSAKQVIAFRKFERELGDDHNGGCTTREKYRLQNSSSHIDMKDTTCAWNGFGKLMQVFFREDK